MSNEIIFLVEDSMEGGYEAKALDYPIFTEADTIKNLHKMVKDSIRCHFEPEDMPKIIRLHFVKEEVIPV
ncbi:MAG: hypothetical protein K8R79_03400 [Calditrichales bacterium]|nr:hypothetical protein [Calditrichales bacterium]